MQTYLPGRSEHELRWRWGAIRAGVEENWSRGEDVAIARGVVKGLGWDMIAQRVCKIRRRTTVGPAAVRFRFFYGISDSGG